MVELLCALTVLGGQCPSGYAFEMEDIETFHTGPYWPTTSNALDANHTIVCIPSELVGEAFPLVSNIWFLVSRGRLSPVGKLIPVWTIRAIVVIFLVTTTTSPTTFAVFVIIIVLPQNIQETSTFRIALECRDSRSLSGGRCCIVSILGCATRTCDERLKRGCVWVERKHSIHRGLLLLLVVDVFGSVVDRSRRARMVVLTGTWTYIQDHGRQG